MTEEVKRAREFAIKAHGDQMYGDEPYIVHLDEVAGILHEFGIMETIFTNAYIVAYLHDTIEDTDITYEDVREEFGETIAVNVAAVSTPEGKNRAVRTSLLYQYIQSIKPAESRDRMYATFLVKPADRLANVRRGGKVEMYRKETAGFLKVFSRRSVQCPSVIRQMLDEIEELAPPIIDN